MSPPAPPFSLQLDQGLADMAYITAKDSTDGRSRTLSTYSTVGMLTVTLRQKHTALWLGTWISSPVIGVLPVQESNLRLRGPKSRVLTTIRTSNVCCLRV